MTVRYTKEAQADLAEIYDYIAADNVEAAKRVRKAIYNTIQVVETHPRAGIRNARMPDVRSRLVPQYPYRVHYQLEGDNLLIVHIRHTRREWKGEP